MDIDPIDPNQPAYPSPRDYTNPADDGITIRAHIATQLMAGILANPGGPIQHNERNGWDLVNCTSRQIAATACGLADALIAELNNPSE